MQKGVGSTGAILKAADSWIDVAQTISKEVREWIDV
jgi:hypothetical protein